MEKGSREGDTPVLVKDNPTNIFVDNKMSCLGLQLKMGYTFILNLNIGGISIAYKYREGKIQRTLKRE